MLTSYVHTYMHTYTHTYMIHILSRSTAFRDEGNILDECSLALLSLLANNFFLWGGWAPRSQLAAASRAIGDDTLESKFDAGIALIKRDIVFAASLYL